ncbi:MAG: radical SAM protein [Sedimentisphaerales bacterium]|nr:radical SAM protein [Sedimentisphaerales bacterium]
MLNSIKKFRNAHWFKGHLYAYGNLLKRKRNIRQGRKFLWNAELFFDTRCNFKCLHCSISKFQKQRDFKQWMSLDEIEHVAEQLRRMDCFLCCLVGGETTLRKDLCEIVSKFHERRILPTIITNGYLVDKGYLRELKKAGLFSIGFSLNGGKAESHDSFVCKPGAFDKALESIDSARESGMCVSIAVVPTRQSIANGEYRRLIEFAVRKGIRVNVNYPALCGEYTGDYDELLTPSEIREVREYFKLPNVTSDFTVLAEKYECPAGRKKIYILPDGSVCPCTFIHISFGNMLEEALEEIMDRLWCQEIFMSRPGYCLASESIEFNEKYLEPVFKAEKVPLDYREHPMLGSAASEAAVEAGVGVEN